MSDDEYYDDDEDDVCEECYGQNCEEDEDKGYCDCEDCNCYEINSDDDDMSIKDIIDNLDVEADDFISENKYLDALKNYLQMVIWAEELQRQGEEAYMKFKALGKIVHCMSKLKQTTPVAFQLEHKEYAEKYGLEVDHTSGDIESVIIDLLKFSSDPSVRPVDKDDTITSILEDISSFDMKLQIKLYNIMLDFLWDNKQYKLFNKTAIKIIVIYLEFLQGNNGYIDDIEGLIKKIHEAYNAKRQIFKNYQLCQYYAIECLVIRRKRALGLYDVENLNVKSNYDDSKREHDIYKEIYDCEDTYQVEEGINTKDLINSDELTKGILYGLLGLGCMKEKNFRKAYNILYKAFSFEKEDSVKVNILKYVGLVGILGEAQHNLYSDVAAVIYAKSNPTIQKISSLRDAYDATDLTAFMALLQDPQTGIKNDDLVSHFHNLFVKIISCRKIKFLVKAYARVKLSYLAERIQSNEDSVERYLASLICTGQISGKINQVKGYFTNEGVTVNQKERQCMIAIGEWAESLPMGR